ncbi:hypothetical protein EV182_002295, partial [Spiromyces aspiralis]
VAATTSSYMASLIRSLFHRDSRRRHPEQHQWRQERSTPLPKPSHEPLHPQLKVSFSNVIEPRRSSARISTASTVIGRRSSINHLAAVVEGVDCGGGGGDNNIKPHKHQLSRKKSIRHYFRVPSSLVQSRSRASSDATIHIVHENSPHLAYSALNSYLRPEHIGPELAVKPSKASLIAPPLSTPPQSTFIPTARDYQTLMDAFPEPSATPTTTASIVDEPFSDTQSAMPVPATTSKLFAKRTIEETMTPKRPGTIEAVRRQTLSYIDSPSRAPPAPKKGLFAPDGSPVVAWARLRGGLADNAELSGEDNSVERDDNESWIGSESMMMVVDDKPEPVNNNDNDAMLHSEDEIIGADHPQQQQQPEMGAVAEVEPLEVPPAATPQRSPSRPSDLSPPAPAGLAPEGDINKDCDNSDAEPMSRTTREKDDQPAMEPMTPVSCQISPGHDVGDAELKTGGKAAEASACDEIICAEGKDRKLDADTVAPQEKSSDDVFDPDVLYAASIPLPVTPPNKASVAPPQEPADFYIPTNWLMNPNTVAQASRKLAAQQSVISPLQGKQGGGDALIPMTPAVHHQRSGSVEQPAQASLLDTLKNEWVPPHKLPKYSQEEFDKLRKECDSKLKEKDDAKEILIKALKEEFMAT